MQASSNASTNYGTLTLLRAADFGVASGSSSVSYLKLDLTGVTSAPQFSTLKLTVNSGSTPTTGIPRLKIYGVSDTTWTETGVTWNNAPGLDRTNFLGTGTLLTQADVPLSGGVASFDVSNYVASHIGSVITLQVISETNDSLLLKVNSREATTGKPILVMASSGARLLDVPAPAWAEAVIPRHSAGAGVYGPSAADGVALASGVYENEPGADASVRNPVGPTPIFGRSYRTWNAYNGYASPGLPLGWTHNYDVTVKATDTTGWKPLTLIYPNRATETWTPNLVNGLPDGTFNLPAGTPYLVTGMASGTTGRWTSLTITYKDESKSAFSFNPNTTNQYALTGMVNIAGRAIGLYYDASSRLTDCKDDNNTIQTLLHLDYANGGYISRLTEYSDPANPRKVDYGTSVINMVTVLSTVSQMYTVAAGRQDWKYDYTANAANGALFLSKVSVYNPAVDDTTYVSNSIVYDTAGRVSALTDANGNQQVYTYAGQTQVTTQDKNGIQALQWFQSSDAQNKNTGDTDFLGLSSITDYGDINNVYMPTQSVNRNGQTAKAFYDLFGNTTSEDAPVNDLRLTATTNYLYTSFALGRVDNIVVGNKTPTNVTYYTGNTIVNSVLQPNGLVATVRSPKPGVQEGGTTGAQVTTTYVYTALGNVASVTRPAPNSTVGAMVTSTLNYVTDTVGGITTTKVEALGEPLSATDPAATNDPLHTTHFRYDARGNVISTIDANGYQTDYTYNYLDQLTRVTYPPTVLGGARAYLLYIYTNGDNTGPLKSTQLYNEAGNPERQSSRSGGIEDETTKVAGSTEALGASYDALYRPTLLTDGNGKTHVSTYNAIGELSKFAYPLANGANFDQPKATGFDNNHNLTGLTDGNGSSFTFDLANGPTGDDRLKVAHYPTVGTLAAYNATYTCDDYGRIRTVAYGADTYAYTYDDNDLLLSETVTYATLPVGNNTRTTSYTYNPDGSRATMSVDTNVALTYTYTYDNAGRLRNTAFSWGDSVTNSYLSNNWVSAQYNSIINTPYIRNGRGWITSLTNTYRADGTRMSFANTFTRDAMGNILSYYQEMGAVYAPTGAAGAFTGTVTYAYDSASVTNQDRLTLENSTRTATGNTNNNLLVGFNFTHASDLADNLTTLRSLPLSYNIDNQLVGPTYDGQGNPTLYNWGGASTTFAWDAEDRLASFGTIFTAGYRVDGLRAWKQTGAASTRHYFLYEGGHVLAELDASGNLVNAYGWGAAGLSERYDAGLGIYYAYTFDPAGNTIERHASNTTIEADYTTLYDAFGGQRGAVDTRSGYSVVKQDAVGWAGQWGGYTDQETVSFPGSGMVPVKRYPLVMMGHRYYDPGAGRFLNRDPVGMEGGVNIYAYCQNNPINFYDPLGLDDDLLDKVTSFSAGWGSALTFGLTDRIQERMGTASAINRDSGYYKAGEVVGTIHNTILMNAAGKALAATKAYSTAATAIRSSKVATRIGTVLKAPGVLAARLVKLAGKCFVAGTPVQMADGTTKPIEQIKIGEWVQSRDANTGITRVKQVTQTFAHDADATMLLTFGNGETIEATPTHPFYVLGRGFVPASQLGIGTSIVTRAGPAATLTAKTNHTGATRVYNFEVADFHTYFVGKSDGGLWVHNICPSLGILEGKFASVTQSGISVIERHLARLHHSPVNDAMLARLRTAMASGQKISGADLSYYAHELSEASGMDRGLSYDAAHEAALLKYGASRFSVYHPSVIAAYPAFFNNLWRKEWGL